MIDQALTAGFVGIIIILTKVIEYFLSKQTKTKTRAELSFNNPLQTYGMEKIADRLENITEKLIVVADRLDRNTK